MLSHVFLLLFAYVSLIGKNGKTIKPLQSIVKELQVIRPSTENINLEDPKEVNTYLQTCWLRKAGTEHNTMQFNADEAKKVGSRCKGLIYKLSKLNMVSEYHPPTHKDIKLIAIFGGSYPRMQERIKQAARLYKSITTKQKPEKIIVLTGERTLEKERKDNTAPLDQGAPDNCETEKEAAEHLISSYSKLPFSVIHANKQQGQVRAQTGDNISALACYLKNKKIDQGTIVFVSTQPLINYHMAQAQRLKKDFPKITQEELTVKEKGLPIHHFILMATDSLARQLYTELKNLTPFTPS